MDEDGNEEMSDNDNENENMNESEKMMGCEMTCNSPFLSLSWFHPEHRSQAGLNDTDGWNMDAKGTAAG
jgi:hypothetical protein